MTGFFSLAALVFVVFVASYLGSYAGASSRLHQEREKQQPN